MQICGAWRVVEKIVFQGESAHLVQHRLPSASLRGSLASHHHCSLDPHRLLSMSGEVNSLQWWTVAALSGWDVSTWSVYCCALAFSAHAHHRPLPHRAHYRRHPVALP